MKTLKFTMVAVFLALAMTAYAGEEPPAKEHPNKVVKIKLSKAITNPELLEQMILQLHPSMLKKEIPGYYIGYVTYEAVDFWIYGSLNQWKKFFDMYWHGSTQPTQILNNRLE